MALAPIVADRIGEYLPIVVESASRYWQFHRFGWLQFRAGIFVPKTERPIGAHCGQSAVHRMECDIIDGVNVLIAVWGAVRAMALECEIVFRV